MYYLDGGSNDDNLAICSNEGGTSLNKLLVGLISLSGHNPISWDFISINLVDHLALCKAIFYATDYTSYSNIYMLVMAIDSSNTQYAYLVYIDLINTASSTLSTLNPVN
jgi:hypothetical protein